jgi:hypothetical protein
MRKRFLAKTMQSAQSAHVLRQNIPERAFVGPFHSRK